MLPSINVVANFPIADIMYKYLHNAGVAQLVEHLLAMQDVVGSSPITRSNMKRSEMS